MQTLITLESVKKHYRDKTKTTKALDGVSFEIFQGEIFGLLGVNGAGKTTLSSLLATLHRPTSGDILFDNRSIYKEINSYRMQIGFCPQTPNLIDSLSVEKNLIFAGRYFNVPEETIKSRLETLIKTYNLEEYRHSKPTVLSGGYKQRVLLARSLMHNPKLIILDEPTVGLDPHIRQALWENIRALKENGVSVVLTTHYLDEAEALSDRICILDKGKVRLIDTPEKLKSSYQKGRLEDVFIQLIKEEAGT